MENNFTPLHFKTQIVEFDLFYNSGTDSYRTAVSAPIDFEVQFKFINGSPVRISNNPDFYSGLIDAIEKAILRKRHLILKNKASMFLNKTYASGKQELQLSNWFRPLTLPRLFE